MQMSILYICICIFIIAPAKANNMRGFNTLKAAAKPNAIHCVCTSTLLTGFHYTLLAFSQVKSVMKTQ